jgi:hypothetical protein
VPLTARKVLADWKQRLEFEKVFDGLVLLVSGETEDFTGTLDGSEPIKRLRAYASGKAETNHEQGTKQIKGTYDTGNYSTHNFAGRVMLSVADIKPSIAEYEGFAFMILGDHRSQPDVTFDGEPRTLSVVDFDDDKIAEALEHFPAARSETHEFK